MYESRFYYLRTYVCKQYVEKCILRTYIDKWIKIQIYLYKCIYCFHILYSQNTIFKLPEAPFKMANRALLIPLSRAPHSSDHIKTNISPQDRNSTNGCQSFRCLRYFVDIIFRRKQSFCQDIPSI